LKNNNDQKENNNKQIKINGTVPINDNCAITPPRFRERARSVMSSAPSGILKNKSENSNNGILSLHISTVISNKIPNKENISLNRTSKILKSMDAPLSLIFKQFEMKMDDDKEEKREREDEKEEFYDIKHKKEKM